MVQQAIARLWRVLSGEAERESEEQRQLIMSLIVQEEKTEKKIMQRLLAVEQKLYGRRNGTYSE